MNPSIDSIPFHRPSLGAEEEKAVVRVLRSGWLTTAGESRALETEFAEAVGAQHALAVNSATSGLHLALEAVGVGPGDRVITTPYTFTASAEVIRYLGADPLFVDIREDDLNIDPDLIRDALTAQAHRGDSAPVKAILPVHFGGHPCDMKMINEMANEHGVATVEDAAHAFPAAVDERSLGRWGDVGVYSFYATKTMTTGEGGMIVTDRADLAKRMSVMRLHGIDREVWDRYTSPRPSWQYEVVEAGYKYNLPDLLAAIGRVQLQRAHEFAERRKKIADLYDSLLGDRDYLRLPIKSEDSSWHLYVVRVQAELLTVERDELMQEMADNGVATSLHYIPLHIMPYYRNRYGFNPETFPISLRTYQRAMSLPIYPALSDEQVERVARTLISLCDKRRRK
jgi:dTDP-4-amino-4,6-dideoxygalactose transaminase